MAGSIERVHGVELAASPREVFGVLTDYESLPSWQGPLESCNVLTRDDEGRGRTVEYVVDAKLRTVRYVLEHTYDAPSRIGSRYVEGDFAAMDGEWTLTEAPGGCDAVLRMSIDPGLPLPGRLINKVNDRVLKRAVEDLGDRVGTR